MLDDRQIRIRIQEVQKHTDPTDLDPQHGVQPQFADPYHFNADPDPALRFNHNPDPAPYQMMRIWDH